MGGSDDERKKKKKDKKKDRKKSSRDRKERDRSRSRDRNRNRDRSEDNSSDSESVKQSKKKPRKSKSKQAPPIPTPHKFMYPMTDMRANYSFPPPPFYMPMMGDHPITPPPPIAPPSQSLNKSSKTKEPNIFKLLPILPNSIISFCTTIFSADLVGQECLQQLIGKVWKNLDKKARALGVRRISKLVSEGMMLHDKLINKQSKSVMIAEEKPALPQPSSDFELITAMFNRTPLEKLSKQITSTCTLKKQDFVWPQHGTAQQ